MTEEEFRMLIGRGEDHLGGSSATAASPLRHRHQSVRDCHRSSIGDSIGKWPTS